MRLTGLAVLMFTGCATPTPLEQAFIDQGFTVQRGKVSSFLVEDCELLSTCFGNNATTPYFLVSLPSYPKQPETLPLSTIGDIPKVPEDMSPSYRIESNEAIVIRGQTPPQTKYFGLTPYVYSRTDATDTPIDIFASIADSINQLQIKTDGTAAFNAETAVIYTADSQTLEAAKEALIADGLPETAINAVVLPQNELRLGLNNRDDTLLVLGRYALIENRIEQQEYLENVPLDVYRLSSDEWGTPLAPPPRQPKGDGLTEDALTESLDALDRALLQAFGDSTFEKMPITPAKTVAGFIDPAKCLQDVSPCLGDNADTTYSAGPLEITTDSAGNLQVGARDDMTLGEEETFVVFGVNHAKANKALYSNFGLYTAGNRIGVAAVTDDQLEGSAQAYLPDNAQADTLFVYEIRRSCGDRPYCMELPETFPGASLSQAMFFIFRAYLNPGLTVSAAPDELLTERVYRVGAGW